MQETIQVKNDRQWLTKLCEATPFTCTEIIAKNRKSEIALYRHVIYYILRVDLEWKLKRICELMQRDHSTILSGVDKIEGELPVYNNTVETYRMLLNRASCISFFPALDPISQKDMITALTMVI